MYLIIDAYNVLHKLIKTKSTPGEPGERDKQLFITQLKKYAARKGHRLLVVFDGGPLPVATHEKRDGVTIVHVGYKETADDYIKRVLDDAQKELVLVSSDNALIKHAKMLGIESVDAQTFAKILAEKKVETKGGLVAGAELQRLHAEEQEDQTLAMLMEEESRRLPVKEEDLNIDLKIKHTPSKKERQQSKVLKKL